MPQYTILIYEDEATYADATPEEFGAVLAAHDRFTAQVHEAGGRIVGGAALEPTSTATSLRGTRTDAVTTTDGPFAESKEALGGFYLLEADDLDHALRLARLCPADGGGVEVRPVMQIPQA